MIVDGENGRKIMKLMRSDDPANCRVARELILGLIKLEKRKVVEKISGKLGAYNHNQKKCAAQIDEILEIIETYLQK